MKNDLRVGVPDAARGRSLVARLAHSELTGSDESGWMVVTSVNGDLPGALTVVREWLGTEGIEHTPVHIGDRTLTMTRE